MFDEENIGYQQAGEYDYLMHYGTPHDGSIPHSGRYAYGSGKNPNQRSGDLVSRVKKLKAQGLTEKEIAEAMGFKNTSQLRVEYRAAHHEERSVQAAEARRLRDEGYTLDEIAEKMGYKNDSSIRSLLNEGTAERMSQAQSTAEFLKNQIAEKGYLDVGKGVERELGISRTKLDEALYLLEREGYVVYNRGVAQVTNQGQQTILKVLTPPGTEYKDVYSDLAAIKSVTDYKSTDDGQTFVKKGFQYPESLDSKRLMIRFAEDGGVKEDGLIELRPGVADIDLGEGVHYAQVRIMVDGTHYLKGMACYAYDLPDGVDVRFNTNKTKDVPVLGPKDNTVLKPIKKDPDNPFGSLIKEEGGQYEYTDRDGKKKLSLINKRADEGDWGEWADHLASQFLGKQSMQLIDKQLNLSYADKLAEYEEISALNNPTVKKRLLKSFADDCDAGAVHLKAAALPRQKYQVILPLTQIKDNEIYAPNYEDGETLALIRYPHGGTFEIPILKVNNKNEQGKARITPNGKDAVGISAKNAEILSGADFDGDTVMVIPCNSSRSKVRITSTPPLKGLEGFDPKMEYKIPEGDKKTKRMTSSETQKQMGIVSNLITDMTLRGATDDELARAVRHSMVVIDAEKHGLNYKQSEKDNGIAELKKKYQGRIDPYTGEYKGGATTLISLAKSEVRVPKRRGTPKIDPETGEYIYKESGETYTDRKGNVKVRTQTSTQMAEAKDARSLISPAGTPVEERYALYANQLKGLANAARKELMATGNIQYKPSAAKAYSPEVADLKSQLNQALKNAPRERQAQILANSDVKAKKQANPDMTKKEVSKAATIALNKRRKELGAERKLVKISDKQWEAIQNGAVSENILSEILNHTDIDLVKERATPRASNSELSASKQARIKAYAASGYTNAEIAKAVGVSASTVTKYL